MRPRIVTFLNELVGTELINYLVPTGLTIYVMTLVIVGWVFVKRCERLDSTKFHLLGICLFAIIGGLIGARLFYVLQHYDCYIENPLMVLNCSGGSASWGAYVGGLFGFLFYLVVAKLPILKYLDVLGSSLGLGPFIGRWACFLSGCCFGTLTTLPWGVQYPQYSSAYRKQIDMGIINEEATLSSSVHPVQIYASIAGLIIFFILSKIWNKYNKLPGVTFAAYWLIYGVLRFGIEFFRGDIPRFTSLQLSLSQIICLLLISFSTIGILYLLFKYQNKERLPNF
jgi:phosphatidylglycerol:prolipoprotein diacylglycerol transferase